MNKPITSLLIVLFLCTSISYSQEFTESKDLLKYYKENLKEFPNPETGWHEVWVIMPKENEYAHEFENEVVEASVFLVDGEVTKVFYNNNNYHESVYSLNTVKKGKTTYQKVILNIDKNLTEVYTAYKHTVIFKNNSKEIQVDLDEYEKEGNMTFFSSNHKVTKQGFFVFVRNINTKEYDFLGYLNKRCEEVVSCNKEDGLNTFFLHGNYEIVTVQDKIQFNRQMPTQRYNVQVTQEDNHTLELIASN